MGYGITWHLLQYSLSRTHDWLSLNACLYNLTADFYSLKGDILPLNQ